MKKIKILLIFIVLFLNGWNVSGQQCPIDPNCLVSSVILNTGKNHQINTNYPVTKRDEYWRLDSGPATHGPYPRCPFVISNTASGGSLSASANGIADGNVSQNNKCSYNGTPYVFQRDFQVCTGPGNPVLTAILNTISFYNDLKVTDIRIIQPSGLSFVISTSCWPNGTNTIPPYSFPVQTGVYTLQITVGNDWTNTANWPLTNYNGQTGMALDYQGFVICGAPIFIDNKHFGKNVNTPSTPNYCAPAYVIMEVPTFINYCIQPPASIGTVTIPNFNPAFNYSISSGTINTTNGTFSSNVGNTYTVTVSDGTGCTVSSSVTIVPNNMQVTLNNLPSGTPATLQCMPQGYTSNNIIPIPTNGTAPYTILAPTSTSPNPNVPGLYGGWHFPVGSHIITVTDANTCSIQKTYNVGNLFTTAYTASPPCVTGNTQTVSVSPNVPVTYTFAGGPIVKPTDPPNMPNAHHQYTVTATDAYGCTATSTIYLYPNPVAYSYVNNAVCPTVTTGFPVNMATYQWIGAPFQGGIQYANNVAINSNCQNIPPTAGVTNAPYILKIVDSLGCKSESTGIYNYNPFCCDCFSACSPLSSMQYYPNSWSNYATKKFSPIAPYSNNNILALKAAFGNPANNIITTNNEITFDGTMVLSQDIHFVNCPNMLFTQNAKIIVMNGATVTFSYCKLRTFCHDILWDGIYTNSPTNGILRIENCEIRDAKNGIVSNNGGKIRVYGNQFKNNQTGVTITNSPSGFGYNSGCQIVSNTFSTSAPSANQCGIIPGETGVRVTNCRSVEIGHMDGGISTNLFKNIKFGVKITSNRPLQIEDYYVLENRFENIGIPNTLEWQIYQMGGGAAIDAQSTLTTNNNHTLHVDYGYNFISTNTFNLPVFKCDKIIRTQYTSAKINNLKAESCLIGFVFENANNQLYSITQNYFSGANLFVPNNFLVGIQVNGNMKLGSVITGNTIKLRTNPMMGNWVNPTFPSGINIRCVSPGAGSGVEIKWNSIQYTANAGVGFSIKGCNKNTELIENSVDNQNLNPLAIIGNQNLASHYSLENCIGTMLLRNNSFGNNSMLSQINDITGMQISSSTQCKFICNKFEKSRLGTVVRGVCQPSTFKMNQYKTHGNALRFEAGASLGPIGTFLMDYNNTFTNSGMFLAPFNFPIFRFHLPGSGNPQYFSNTLTQAMSGTSVAGLGSSYLIQSAVNVDYDGCESGNKPANNALPLGDDLADDIALDSIKLDEVPNAAESIDDQQLFAAIANGDSSLLSDPAVYAFYVSSFYTRRDELYEVDLLIGELNDSTIANDSTLFEQKLQEIEVMNNRISGGDTIELKEQMTNRWYLTWLRYGIDSLSEEDSIALENLAMSCPTINGKAVFKARSLYASLNPGFDYNDKVICGNVGAYKTSGAQAEETMDMAVLDGVLLNNIKLYPNPTDGIVNIDYVLPLNTTAKITLYDMVGRACLTADFGNNSSQLSFNVGNLPSGIYSYKLLINNNVKQTGKLLINK
jgi:hypothetical protein